jgi:hypothetical protein
MAQNPDPSDPCGLVLLMAKKLEEAARRLRDAAHQIDRESMRVAAADVVVEVAQVLCLGFPTREEALRAFALAWNAAHRK